ncbi:MAG: SDR family oxidoreductase [Chloroflexi bacterium]|nr:SDR family oxidoreductase [Chloroflexota bacterium]
MLLSGKIAVIYGAAGSIGSAVARGFAREGARVFLTGRKQTSLETLAHEIREAGGLAEVALVDALDQPAIEAHLADVIAQTGRIDISFNAIWIRGDLQGTPLVQMPAEHFSLPIMTGVTTHFLTATAAARAMIKQQSGVILTLSASSSVLSGRERRYHLTGGFSTACSAIEGFTYSLAGEVGVHGVRVVCLRSDALPETWGTPAEQIQQYMQAGTALGRLPSLNEVANSAILVASDYASAMTGTIANLTCGSIMA